jgi:hypothetical protein
MTLINKSEKCFNDVFIGIVLRKLGIYALLNITSILRFGSGTKRIMSGILNSTLVILADAALNLIR